MLSELAIEREDEATLMEMAGKTGDGVISFDEFKTLMHATSRPNPITRVSMMAPGMAPGLSGSFVRIVCDNLNVVLFRRAELWSTPLMYSCFVAGTTILPNIAEDATAPMDIEAPARPAGKNLSRNGMSFQQSTPMATSPPIGASPVSSLMTAMEAKYADSHREPRQVPHSC